VNALLPHRAHGQRRHALPPVHLGQHRPPQGRGPYHRGYLLQAALTHRYVFDYHDGDIFACVADIGWITGHSYVVYGPLCNGATTVLFESIPLYPDAGRYWDMVERHRITQFYTSPTAIRSVAREGDAFVKAHDRSSLRILGTVGEPINPEAWRWYHQWWEKVAARGRYLVADGNWGHHDHAACQERRR